MLQYTSRPLHAPLKVGVTQIILIDFIEEYTKSRKTNLKLDLNELFEVKLIEELRDNDLTTLTMSIQIHILLSSPLVFFVHLSSVRSCHFSHILLDSSSKRVTV
jgi:hypothetical protein